MQSDFAHLYPTSFGKYPFPKVLKYRHLRLLGKLLGDFCAFGKDDFPKVKGCNILFTSFIVLFKKGCNILFLLGKSSFPADSTNSYVQSHFLSDTLAAEQAPATSKKAIQPLKALPLCITRQRKQYNL